MFNFRYLKNIFVYLCLIPEKSLCLLSVKFLCMTVDVRHLLVVCLWIQQATVCQLSHYLYYSKCMISCDFNTCNWCLYHLPGCKSVFENFSFMVTLHLVQFAFFHSLALNKLIKHTRITNTQAPYTNNCASLIFFKIYRAIINRSADRQKIKQQPFSHFSNKHLMLPASPNVTDWSFSLSYIKVDWISLKCLIVVWTNEDTGRH